MIRPRNKPRPGRLKGNDLEALRRECWERDGGSCRRCGRPTEYGLHHYWPQSFHMSHIKAKRIGGDHINNVETLCGGCHRELHNFGPSMTKPVPPKEGSR